MDTKKTILIVDDDVDFSSMAKMMLEKTGLFEVGICNQGAGAVARIQSWKPDLLLLDIVMPDMDGTEIASQLRKEKGLCNIPVIFLTSLMTPSEAAKNPATAHCRFIAKPITGQELIQHVKEFFGIGYRSE